MNNQNIEQPKKKNRKWLWMFLGSLLLGIFLMFAIGPHIGFLGFIGLLLFFFGPVIALFVKSREEKKIMEGVIPEPVKDYQRIEVQPKKKANKWPWIVGGFVLFIILISIIGGGEKKGEVGPAQVSQPQSSQKESSEKTQVSPEVKKLIEDCKSETVRRYGSQGDKFFFCGCYCGLFIEYPDIFANCQNECLEWVFKGVFK